MDINAAKLKVAKLLRLSEDGSASGSEAETALRMAEKLMQKYGIERAQLIGSGDKPVYDWQSGFYGFGREGKPTSKVPLWYQWLVVAIAKFTDTIVVTDHHPVEGAGVRFKGEAEDVILALWFAEYLKDCIRRETRQAGMGSSQAREEFRKVMSLRLSTRMREMREARNQAFSTSTALVVVNSKRQARDKHFGGASYRKGRDVQISNAEAHRKGYDAANRVQFNNPLGDDHRAGFIN